MSRRLPLPAVLAAATVVVIAVVAAYLHARGGDDRSPSARSDSSHRSTRLVPPSSKLPASGVCGRAAGDVLTVRIEPDAPNPVCTSVTGRQSLRVVNSTADYGQRGHAVTVSWVPGRTFRLAVGQARSFPQHFASYLARGVHDLKVTSASGYTAEIWLH